MRRPTGIFAHHNFAQLSQACRGHRVEIQYESEKPFVLPEKIRQYEEELKAYWLNESPGLRDYESIVCVFQAATWQRSGPGIEVGRILLQMCPTTYFSFLFSNYSLDVPLSDGNTLRSMYENGDFGLFRQEPRGAFPRGVGVEHFNFPKFGNSLGITVSVVTADSKLIIAKRSGSAAIARDKGNWLCAVGTQVERCDKRFLNPITNQPCPFTSAEQGLRDEMGEAVGTSCDAPLCLGIVYREDCQHCELLYEVVSKLSAQELIDLWQKAEVPSKRKIEWIEAIDLSKSPDALLAHLGDRNNAWSPQHAAGAFHSAAKRFPKEMSGFGLQL